MGIGRFADYKARTLSYGDQRRLEIARALATDPKLIALDEPAAGMNATEKVVLRELIDRIRKDGRTILLIEHDVKLVMGLCDRVTVLDYGKQIAEGTPVRRAAQREGDRGLPRRRPQGALISTDDPHRMAESEVLLKVSGLKVAYGGIQAVKGVSFEVREGELVSLIGANGAGKTTTLKAITGTQPVRDGDIEFLGRSIKGQGAWDLVQAGPGDGARGPRRVHAHDHHREPADGRLRARRRRDRGRHRTVFGVFPRLKERARAAGRHDVRRRAADAGDGPRADGAAQGAADGRAVDGPVADHGRQDLRGGGRHPLAGTTILLVEQNASRALQLANRGYVMESGEITMSGDAKALLNDPKVRAAYLGE